MNVLRSGGVLANVQDVFEHGRLVGDVLAEPTQELAAAGRHVDRQARLDVGGRGSPNLSM